MNRKNAAAIFLIGLWASLALNLSTRPAAAADLKVTITGVPSDDGALMIGLYESAANFEGAITDASKETPLEDKRRLVGATLRARTGSQSIGFLGLPAGHYAVIVFHDANDNARLDEDMLGIPTEAYGFSNNVMGLFSAPSFEASAVAVDGDTAIEIALHPPATPLSPQTKTE